MTNNTTDIIAKQQRYHKRNKEKKIKITKKGCKKLTEIDKVDYLRKKT